jgi:hypothetical protein
MNQKTHNATAVHPIYILYFGAIILDIKKTAIVGNINKSRIMKILPYEFHSAGV